MEGQRMDGGWMDTLSILFNLLLRIQSPERLNYLLKSHYRLVAEAGVEVSSQIIVYISVTFS